MHDSVDANVSVLAAREYAIVRANRQPDFCGSNERHRFSFYFRGLLELPILVS